MDDPRRIIQDEKRSMYIGGWWGNGGPTRNIPEMLQFMDYPFHKRSSTELFSLGNILRKRQRMR